MTPRRPLLIQTTAAAALMLVAAGPALAQKTPPSFPPFPTQRSLTAVADWTRRYSDVPLFAVELSPEQAPPPGVRAVIRQEAITPDFAKRLGGRSVSMVADIDCDGRRVFQRGVDLHTGSNLQGPSRQLGAAADWQAIPPGTYMDRVMAAVCNPTWRPLYAAAPVAPPAPAPGQPVGPSNLPVPYATLNARVPRTPAAPSVAQSPAPPLQAAPYATLETRTVPVPPSPRAAPPPARAGGGRVELGLFGSTDEAIAAWRSISGTAAVGRRLRIELTVDGRQTLYRALVEGFANRLEAETACAAMNSYGVDCAVVN
jgi:hypothetical protein